MKKNKTKPKATPKEGTPGSRGKVIKLKAAKPKAPWTRKLKLPSLGQYWESAKQFVVGAWQELQKVTWPSRRETLGTTGVVLILVAVIAIFLGLVDLGLSRLVRQLMH